VEAAKSLVATEENILDSEISQFLECRQGFESGIVKFAVVAAVHHKDEVF
jgi:hypothetical protein